jgi:aminoglycoside/choline kinase family phosphotransferase
MVSKELHRVIGVVTKYRVELHVRPEYNHAMRRDVLLFPDWMVVPPTLRIAFIKRGIKCGLVKN